MNYYRNRMKEKIGQLSLLLGLLVAFSAGPLLAADPVGTCPDTSSSLIEIANLMQAPEKHLSQKAYILLKWDSNGDGYACANFKCTLCPINAPYCHQHCSVYGPFSDNDLDL